MYTRKFYSSKDELDYEDYEALYYGILEAEEDEQLQAAVQTLQQQRR